LLALCAFDKLKTPTYGLFTSDEALKGTRLAGTNPVWPWVKETSCNLLFVCERNPGTPKLGDAYAQHALEGDAMHELLYESCSVLFCTAPHFFQ
jgi:hypothetical protein